MDSTPEEMTPKPREQASQQLQRLSLVFGWLTVVVGFLVVLGWIFHIPALTTVLPNLPSMKLNTCVSFMMLGLALVAANRTERKGTRTRRAEMLIVVCSGIVLLISLLTLAEYLFGVDFAIDELLIKDVMMTPNSLTPPGRMSPITATNFVLLSSAFLASRHRQPWDRIWQSACLLCVFSSLVALLGYFYDASSLARIYPYSTIAVHTSTCFVLLSFGLLFLRPNTGFMSAFTSGELGGIIGRRLLPLAIFGLLFLGFLVRHGQYHQVYDAGFSVVFIVALGVAMMSALIWWNTELISGIDRARKLAIDMLAAKEAELRKANEELEERVRIRTQESELQAAILRNMAEGVCMVRASDHTIAYANPKFEAMFGYDRGELDGKPVAILNYGGENSEFAQQRAKEIIETTLRECVSNYEIHNVRKDGTPFWCRATTSQFQHPRFGLVIVAVQEDITKRKQAELAVEAAGERNRTPVMSAPDSILVGDAHGEIQLANPQAANTFGYEANELLGQPVEMLIPKRFRDKHQVQRAEFISDSTAHMMGAKGEFLACRRDGSEFPVDISLSPMNMHGKLTVTAIIRNITERRQFEQSLANKAKELERSNTELQQFAYVTSHDLREPLRVVTNYAQLLERRYQGRLDESADKYIGYIVDGVSRMQLLIADLLSYSRVGQGELTFENVPLDEVLAQVLRDLDVKVRETRAVITSDPLPTLSVNRFQIGQLLQNLIDNAMKFHRPDCPPHIRISAQQIAGEWRISVSDDGIGIESQFLDRIFVIFQRLHPRNEYPGTGIGLAICKKIVERHGGRIWADSEFGKGTTFHFTLPSPVNSRLEGNRMETSHKSIEVGGSRHDRTQENPCRGG